MIYEELLAKIDNVIHAVEYGHGIDTSRIVKQLSAFRAVVELHKPIDNPNFPDSDRWCWQCAEGRGYAKYPCPTIQAIEKELV